MRSRVGERLAIWGLGLAVGYGALEQGGFYSAQFQTMAVAVGVAFAGWCLIGHRSRRSLSAGHRLAVGSWLVLAVWALLCGAVAGDLGAARPISIMAALLAVALLTSSSLSSDGRRTLQHVIVLIGLLVALTAWIGVAYHHEPWALLSQSLWRGASTLTYANATAAFLVAPILLSAGRALRGPTFLHLVATDIVVVGWASTLSRGGALSVAAGVGVSVALVRLGSGEPLPWRSAASRLWPLLPSTAVALVALAPSLPEHATPRPRLASAGLVASILVLAAARKAPGLSARWRGSSARGTRIVVVAALVLAFVGTGLLAVGSLAAPNMRSEIRAAIDGIRGNRLDFQSSDRADLWRVTWEQAAAHPAFGVGPGQVDFHYVSSSGQDVQAEFTHNEYLQLAAEVGVPGVLLASMGGLALAVACLRVRGCRGLRGLRGLVGSQRLRAFLCLCVISTFAVHSILDFLWHIPVLPLIVVVTAGSVADCSGKVHP